MNGNENKYEKVISFLKKSEPTLTHGEIIEEKVMERISLEGTGRTAFNILDYLFGWVYIGWVRRGLVFASILIIGLFAFQQALILKRINSLEKQTVADGNRVPGTFPGDIEAKFMLFQYPGSMLPLQKNKLSEKQMEKILQSINKLQEQYHDLFQLVESNPGLKQFIENKLSENDKKKLNP